MLAKKPDNEFLFTALQDYVDGKLSTNRITVLVRNVGKDAGIKNLDLHKCRRTFGQMLSDEGMTIGQVSVLMGHHSPATTEQFYCRLKQEKATKAVRNNWGQSVPNETPKVQPGAIFPSIEKRFDITGYG